MEEKPKKENLISSKKQLFWIGIVTLLVGIKLLLSFFIPGLKSSGELILSGLLLLICGGSIFKLRSNL